MTVNILLSDEKNHPKRPIATHSSKPTRRNLQFQPGFAMITWRGERNLWGWHRYRWKKALKIDATTRPYGKTAPPSEATTTNRFKAYYAWKWRAKQTRSGEVRQRGATNIPGGQSSLSLRLPGDWRRDSRSCSRARDRGEDSWPSGRGGSLTPRASRASMMKLRVNWSTSRAGT